MKVLSSLVVLSFERKIAYTGAHRLGNEKTRALQYEMKTVPPSWAETSPQVPVRGSEVCALCTDIIVDTSSKMGERKLLAKVIIFVYLLPPKFELEIESPRWAIDSPESIQVCVPDNDYVAYAQKSTLMDIFENLFLSPEWYILRESLPDMSSEECLWRGVSCTDGIVTRLSFKGEFLRGGQGIPNAVASLSNLEWLDFSNNPEFGGFIPDLSNLKKLSFFDVSGSSLSGSATDIGLCESNDRGRVLSYSPPPFVDTGFFCECKGSHSTVCLPKVRS